MVSAPFATNNTVIKGTKLPENRTVIRKLSFAPQNLAALSLTIAAQFLRCLRTLFFGYSGAIFERSRSPFIDYSGAKYARFPPKIAAMQKSLFEWLKTAITSTACGTVTLKSLLPQGAYAPHVHPRLRKRPPRCTLDCGFKTSESPALRGFEAERAPIRGTSLYLVLLSNGLPRPKIRLKSSAFRPKAFPQISPKSYRHNAVPNRFLFRFSTSRTNGPRLLSQAKVGTHSAFGERSHTRAHTAKQGAFRAGWYHYPRHVLHIHEHPRAGY